MGTTELAHGVVHLLGLLEVAQVARALDHDTAAGGLRQSTDVVLVASYRFGVAATVVILPSPLLPTMAYARLADALRGAGVKPLIADPTLRLGHAVDELMERWAHDAAQSDLLVAHSNAGLPSPVVRSRTNSRTRIVFMDAALLPEAGKSSLAPPALRDAVASLADERGVLPPWTRWWPQETVRTVIPGDLVQAIDGACPRLPVAYFDQNIEVPHGWTSAPNAYLAFGETYAAELDFARGLFWPTDRIEGAHLQFLHEPVLVAERVLALARGLC